MHVKHLCYYMQSTLCTFFLEISLASHQISELVHAQCESQLVGVVVVVVDERLVRPPDHESLQFFHERHVRFPVQGFPCSPLWPVLQRARVESSIAV